MAPLKELFSRGRPQQTKDDEMKRLASLRERRASRSPDTADTASTPLPAAEAPPAPEASASATEEDEEDDSEMVWKIRKQLAGLGYNRNYKYNYLADKPEETEKDADEGSLATEVPRRASPESVKTVVPGPASSPLTALPALAITPEVPRCSSPESVATVVPNAATRPSTARPGFEKAALEWGIPEKAEGLVTPWPNLYGQDNVTTFLGVKHTPADVELGRKIYDEVAGQLRDAWLALTGQKEPVLSVAKILDEVMNVHLAPPDEPEPTASAAQTPVLLQSFANAGMGTPAVDYHTPSLPTQRSFGQSTTTLESSAANTPKLSFPDSPAVQAPIAEEEAETKADKGEKGDRGSKRLSATLVRSLTRSSSRSNRGHSRNPSHGESVPALSRADTEAAVPAPDPTKTVFQPHVEAVNKWLNLILRLVFCPPPGVNPTHKTGQQHLTELAVKIATAVVKNAKYDLSLKITQQAEKERIDTDMRRLIWKTENHGIVTEEGKYEGPGECPIPKNAPNRRALAGMASTIATRFLMWAEQQDEMRKFVEQDLIPKGSLSRERALDVAKRLNWTMAGAEKELTEARSFFTVRDTDWEHEKHGYWLSRQETEGRLLCLFRQEQAFSVWYRCEKQMLELAMREGKAYPGGGIQRLNKVNAALLAEKEKTARRAAAKAAKAAKAGKA